MASYGNRSLIAVVIVGFILIGGLASYSFYASSVNQHVTTLTLTQKTATTTEMFCNGGSVTIGALNDLSGPLSAQGSGELAAEQLAIAEVNSWVKGSGCTVTFTLDSQDYAGDSSMALSELQSMAAVGVHVVIGPITNAAAENILSYANQHQIVLISPSSTSPALHVTDTSTNYLFRTAPNDAAQGQAIAREVLTQGAKAAIIVNRDDTYGGSLANETKSFLTKDGMSASAIGGPYKYAASIPDFISLVAQMTNELHTLNNGAAAGHVAIVAISFQELGNILQQASTQSPAIYNDVPWYGGDSEALTSTLNNSAVGQYTSHVILPSTLFNFVNNSKTLGFYQKYAGTQQLKAMVAGGIFYTMEGYDDVWMAALSIMAAGANSGTAIHAAFPTIANSFYGLTGWEGLSGNDRIPGSYQIWKVVASGSAYNWVLAGTYDSSSDSVSWTSPP